MLLPELRARSASPWPCALRAGALLLLGGTGFAQALVNGGVVRGSIATPGEQDTYTFDAGPGDWFELRVANVAGATFAPRIEVFNPRGALLRSAASAEIAVIDTTRVDGGLSQHTPAGTYTVVVASVEGTRTPTGDYDVHFVLAARDIGEALLDGVTVTGELTRGELDTFTFTAPAGQTIMGTITRLQGSSFRLRGEHIGPTGGRGVGVGGNVIHFTNSTTPGGVHTIVVSDGTPDATGTGRYSVVVHGIPDAPPSPATVFWPSELSSDPLLLDAGGHTGLGPRIGDPAQPFNVLLDCTGADAPGVYLLTLSTGFQSAATTPWGWLYLAGPRPFEKLGQHQRSLESWFPQPAGFVLPNDVTLVGRSFTVQGACGGSAGSLRLSTALTQTIGG
ncbi:MAG TPA: hypothetical protein VF530_21685 [Planctomycetota bacterium]